MTLPSSLFFQAPLQRKDPRLPVYVVVPHAKVAPWGLAGTTVVEGAVNGEALFGGEPALRAAWARLSEANRRVSQEHILSAKTEATRARRAAAIVERLRAAQGG